MAARRGPEGRLVLWDLHARKSIAILLGCTSSLSFHPSGQYLAAATLSRSVVVWDVEAQQQAAELTGHLDTVTCLVYSPDGRWLVTGNGTTGCYQIQIRHILNHEP